MHRRHLLLWHKLHGLLWRLAISSRRTRIELLRAVLIITHPMKQPIRVAVTGPAGQIGYALLFRIASGQMFGPDQPIILQLLEVPVEKVMNALKGVAMELEDCAFPLLADMVITSDPSVGFKD